MNKNYIFVLQLKYGEIYDIFTFDNKEEANEWKKRQKNMFGDDVRFIYTSYVPESWDTFELKKEDWGI